MIIKKHVTQDNRLILAICDSNLINKKFEQGDVQLDLTSGFYAGKEVADEEVISLLKKAFSISAVGENSVAICLKANIIDEENVEKVKNIPYAYMVRM